MAYRTHGLSMALPRKLLLQRVLFTALLAASLLLIYAERQQKDWVTQFKMTLLQVSAPLAQLLHSPAQVMEDASTGWNQLWQVHSENRQLKYDNTQLLHWRDTALRLEAENNALRELMNYKASDKLHFQSAKVISMAGGGVAHRIMVNNGLSDGVQRHMPVLNAHGLIGRTLNVSENHTEVMLLTDISSRIPVVLQPSGLRAILVGDHGKMPYLKLANPKAEPPLGEVVMSSDDGGLLPEGLHVGTLFAARDGRYDVLPAFRNERLDYVRILERQ